MNKCKKRVEWFLGGVSYNFTHRFVCHKKWPFFSSGIFGRGWGGVGGDSVSVKLSKFNFDILEFHSSYKAKLYLVNVILILENG